MVGCDPRGAEHPLHVGWPLGVDDLEFIDRALGHEWACECTPKRVEGGGQTCGNGQMARFHQAIKHTRMMVSQRALTKPGMLATKMPPRSCG